MGRHAKPFPERTPAPPTSQFCPSAPFAQTHHLVPTGPAKARTMRCQHCKLTEQELRTA